MAAVIILGVQYIILSVTNDYADNPNVMNQVSFAGTLTSIILAVLAIVYAFFQSASQEQVSRNVEAQVKILRNVVQDARTSQIEDREKIAQQVRELRAITRVRLEVEEWQLVAC